MNRGRHKSNKISKISKLAEQHGAHYPAAWENNISYENLIKLINTQREKCGFNDLHIFETVNFSDCDTFNGGFSWNSTTESFSFWQHILCDLYYGIKDYIKNKSKQKILTPEKNKN